MTGEHYARTDSGELIGPYDTADECERERIASNAEYVAPCDCSPEYGPCENHGEAIVIREGASTRTADELTMVLIGDLVGIGCELSAWGKAEYARLSAQLEHDRDPHSGCAWFESESDQAAANDLAWQLECSGEMPDRTMLVREDGYVIYQLTEDCPLLER